MTASQRSTCPRAQVGAVIVDPTVNRILATGYNGALSGESHCSEIGCLVEDGHCQRAIHAEVNAIAQAAMFGIPIRDCVIYVIKVINDDIENPSVGSGVCRECRKVIDATRLKVKEYPGGYPRNLSSV